MSVICLFFPRLAVEIVRRRNPRLAGASVVILDGHGEDARVVDRSAEAACEGVLVGMSAGQARRVSQRAAFFAPPTAAAREELQRIAALLGDQAALRSALVRDDCIMATAAAGSGLSRGLEAYSRQLAGAVARESGFAVAAALGSDAAEALANARVAARRAPVMPVPGSGVRG